MKECNQCHKVKPLEDFHKHPKAKDGYNARCKQCQNEYNKGNVIISKHKHYCLNCHCPINYHRKYCSSNCRDIFEWSQRKNYIESTGKVLASITTNDTTARRIAKRYLIEKYGHKCMICGIEEWLGQPIMLICDHIDGNASNLDIDNFRIICPNCDATLPTFCNRNKGKGRGSLGLTK